MVDLKNTKTQKTKWFKDKAKMTFLVSVVLLLIGAFISSMVITNFFSVSVQTKSIETEPVTSAAISRYESTGVKSWCAADIYKPKSASKDNKVPLVFVVPGIQRTKETQSSFNIELLRRGYAVICIDPYGQGESSSSYETQSATQEGYGLFSWLDYVFEHLDDEFDYIDSDLIGAVGHSAGGNACQKLAEREGKIAQERHEKSRVNSIYITGYIRDLTWKYTQCNVGVSYSQNDEGAFQNKSAQKRNAILAKAPEDRTDAENWWLTIGVSDLRYADESIALVDYQLKRFNNTSLPTTPITYGDSTFYQKEVEIGNTYGNPYTYTAVTVNNETCLHTFQPYDTATIANMLNFLDMTFDTNSELSSTDQIWWVREFGGFLTLGAGFVMICSLAVLLLRTKAFASIKQTLPPRTGNQKVRGRILFWLTFAISATIACLSYMACVKWSVDWFPDAATGIQTWMFPQRFTNAVMLWAILNGLVGFSLFFLVWGTEYLIDFIKAKKCAANAQKDAKNVASINIQSTKDVHQDYMSKLDPLKIKGKDFLKTLGLAAILIGTFFLVDILMYLIFHVDMRFMFLSARVTFSPRMLLAILMYIPFFFIFYMANSTRVNCSMRPQNWKEWLSQIIAVLANTLGLVAILFIQYIPMIQNGVVGYTSTVGPQWLFVNLLFSIIPLMAALPILNRFFFNITGKAWLGPIVVCVIFIIMTGGATTVYFGL